MILFTDRILHDISFIKTMQEDPQQINQLFLEEVFAQLQKKKQAAQEPKHVIPIGTIYEGFKTIPIQTLQLKQEHKTHPINGQILWYKDLVKKIYIYRESCPLSFQHQNGFFKAFFEAYIQHGEVKINPDDVWLTIMIYFSKYVNDNSKKLRKAFVNHEGKMQLVVETFEKSEKHWQQFLEKIIVAIRQKTVKKVTEQLECNFSSTDQFSRYFSTVAIMNTFQKYFVFKNRRIVCGITSIHMGGTLQDWQNLSKKLQNLTQFDVDGQLKIYVKKLLPVLDQFVETYKGNANIQFWNNIYHERKNPEESPYRPSLYINGWIIRFFTIHNQLGNKVTLEEIDVPVKEVNGFTKQEKQRYLVGGCRGVSVEQGKVYRPHFSYAVVKKKKSAEEQSLSEDSD